MTPDGKHIAFTHAQTTTESAAAAGGGADLAKLLTHEDVDRARDRWEVARARAQESRAQIAARLRVIWLLVGPGILVFLGENDAPSMLSYSATGARFGVGFFLPFIVLTFIVGYIVQEITVR